MAALVVFAHIFSYRVFFKQSASEEAVPLRWQCPLAVESRVYTSKADVYSFGVLLFEVFSNGKTPYAELAAAEVLPMVRAGHRLERPSPTTPQGILELIRECTQMAVVRRPAMAVVRQWLEQAVRDSNVRRAFCDGGGGGGGAGIAMLADAGPGPGAVRQAWAAHGEEGPAEESVL